MILLNKTKSKTLAEKIEVADNLFTRIIGLMGRDYLKSGEGLQIIPCNSIHSCFMKFRFDAIFIDKNNRVKFLAERIPPWRGAKVCFSAYSVIELPAGVIEETGTSIGDELEFVK